MNFVNKLCLCYIVSTLPLNLTREPVNECTAVPSCANCTAFSPSFINATQERTFTAEIGVSGGLQGYLAITGTACDMCMYM